MRCRLTIAACIPVLLMAACSLPTDDIATPINPNDLGPDIANTTTTSTTTTTTTTPTTIAPPPVTGDSVDTPATTTTTEAPPIATAPVDLFYTVGFSDDMARLTRDLNVDPSVQQIIQELETPRSEVRDLNFQTAVRRGMIEDVRVDRGVATVVLSRSRIDSIPDATLQRAISQLVLTLTSFRTADAGAIGQVRFEVDGEGFAVFVPSFGGQSDAGEALAFSDFSMLLDDATTPVTTTTSPPPTTEPVTTVG